MKGPSVGAGGGECGGCVCVRYFVTPPTHISVIKNKQTWGSSSEENSGNFLVSKLPGAIVVMALTEGYLETRRKCPS